MLINNGHKLILGIKRNEEMYFGYVYLDAGDPPKGNKTRKVTTGTEAITFHLNEDDLVNVRVMHSIGDVNIIGHPICSFSGFLVFTE